MHISIPGTSDDDRTAFSVTKREAERLIASSGVAYAILRPGFVIAPAAYGGSAMLRALATLPVQLPAAESATPFQPVDVEDIAATIAWLAGRDNYDKSADAAVWDLMQPQPVTLGDVIEQLRSRFGTTDTSRIALSGFMLDLGKVFVSKGAIFERPILNYASQWEIVPERAPPRTRVKCGF